MIEYLYRKNKDFKELKDVDNWLYIGYNFKVFYAYKINGIRYDSATPEFLYEIDKLLFWKRLHDD